MSVKNIFITLIIVVACVAIGALVLNVLLPNVATALVDAIEGMIYNATSLQFDFNGNGSDASSGDKEFTEDMNDDGSITNVGGDEAVVGFE